MRQTIYCDHAATAFPKAPGVSEAVRNCLETVGANVGRGSYRGADCAAEAVYEARVLLSRLFGFSEISHVLFTPGQTLSLNLVLFGLLRPGDHVIVSPLEHNAVMRPLAALEKTGVSYSVLPYLPGCGADAEALDALMRPNTKLVLATAASNVSGEQLPVSRISEICAGRGIPLCLDAAQTAGHTVTDFRTLPGLAALCVPGHKGLLGPEGIGALLIRPDFARKLSPFIYGGTGSISHSLDQPERLPDRFEAGTVNLPGIYGLRAAVEFILQSGAETLGREESLLTARFLQGVEGLSGVRIIGGTDVQNRVGVVSLDFPGRDNAEIADRLDCEYGVAVRCGLHCAPMAHRTLNTFPSGTVRFSFGYGNTASEIDRAVEAVQAVLD